MFSKLVMYLVTVMKYKLQIRVFMHCALPAMTSSSGVVIF